MSGNSAEVHTSSSGKGQTKNCTPCALPGQADGRARRTGKPDSRTERLYDIGTIESSMIRRVYLDNNATTPVLPEVLEAMRPYFGERFGNASSIHHHGQETRAAVERARESVAAVLGCRAAEIVFTSGGTEADNLAVFGLVRPGDHIITSTIEHHAVLNACKHLAAKGCEITYVPVDRRGLVDAADVKRAIRPNTKLITIMFANNETGVVQPVAEIGKIAAEADIYFHTDAVQSAGKIAIAVNQIGCDLLTISGHKLHGPQGVGALYVRKGTQLDPMLYGGSHERSRRAGTENVPGIVGLGKAAALAQAGFEREEDKKMAVMRDHLERDLLKLEATGINGASAPRVPNTTNIYFDGIEGEALLTAMGLTRDQAKSSIRFSLGKQNTPEDVDFALEIIPETVARLRALSPSWTPAKLKMLATR